MTDKEAKKLLEKLKKGDMQPMPHYCGKCGVIKGNIVKREITETYNIKGNTKITVKGDAAFCPICGARISDECDRILEEKAYREYRVQKGFLQPEEIQMIRELYGLSPRKFSALLNLGDHVIYDLERGVISTANTYNAIKSVSTLDKLQKYLNENITKLSVKDVNRLRELCKSLNIRNDTWSEVLPMTALSRLSLAM